MAINSYKFHRKAYSTWCNLRSRCRNHPHYQGLSIWYDPSWEIFDNFLADMGDPPVDTELDRIDRTKGYYKQNCRWITHLENNRNSSQTKLNVYSVRLIKGLIKAKNPRVTFKDFAEVLMPIFNVGYGTLIDIKLGRTWIDVI